MGAGWDSEWPGRDQALTTIHAGGPRNAPTARRVRLIRLSATPSASGKTPLGAATHCHVQRQHGGAGIALTCGHAGEAMHHGVDIKRGETVMAMSILWPNLPAQVVPIVTEAVGSGFETVFREKFDDVTDEEWARAHD